MNSNISNDEFHTYFKKMFTGTDQFVNEDVENTVRSQLDCDATDGIVKHVLDAEFSTDEVEKSIDALKRDKSPCVDNLIPEICIESKSLWSPMLCKLFNFIYDNGVYPEAWTTGILALICPY